jgi:hypothetical protein
VSLLDDAKQQIRDEAAAGAKEAVMPWILLCLVLSLLAYTKAGGKLL